MIEEIWKDVTGYEGIYKISNHGRIKSINGILKQSICKGYYKVNLCKDGNIKEGKIHRLVCLAFIPNPGNKPQVNHKNGVKTDNNVENLEWSTAKENVIHAWKNNLCRAPSPWKGVKGKYNHFSKPIIQMDKYGHFINEYDSATIASIETGIARQHISKCCSGTRKSAGNFIWKHK